MHWLRGFMLSSLAPLFLAAFPSTSNYQLLDYGFGNGGGSGGTANYSLEGLAGEVNGAPTSTSNYGLQSGQLATQLANVPGAPTLTNPSNWYNKLSLVIDTAGNPSDSLFAVAISSDNFVTTEYVQSDMTVGPALGFEDYLTYAGWGSGAGSEIIGLDTDTTYAVKVKAFRGEFTESGYGPTATAATVPVSITFDIDVASSDTETAAPYTLALGDLLAGSVTTGSSRVWFDFETNALSGGRIFLFSTYSGLRSAKLTYTIASASVDLAGASEAVGLQSASAAQSSGGPLTAVTPYDGTADNVGVSDAAIRPAYQASTAVYGGRSSMYLKAKVNQTTPAAEDYSDILTIIAAASY